MESLSPDIASIPIVIPSGSIKLEGTLILPESTQSLVLFAHGTGSGRKSPRNTFVSEMLNDAGIGTLLFDLLTEKEDQDMQSRFNIELLTSRLLDATAWVRSQPGAQHLSIGYFGASTGAAAALQAAAKLRDDNIIRAVVSRGGRPDLAASALSLVIAPTLFIVGGNDARVIELNRQAYEHLSIEKKMAIIPGATHLFEEPGTLEEVARLALDWFREHL